MYSCPHCENNLENVDLNEAVLICPHCQEEISLMDNEGSEQDKNPSPEGSVGEDFVSNLEDFGNSSDSSSLEGGLRFCLVLDKIDSKRLEDQVFEVLENKKLFLEVTRLKSQLKKGKLEIQDLSAIKTSFLVRSLQHLPLEIKWTQTSYQRD